MKIRTGLSTVGWSSNPWSKRIADAKILLDRQKYGLEGGPITTNLESLCRGKLSFLCESNLGLRSPESGHTGARVNNLRGSSEKVVLTEDKN